VYLINKIITECSVLIFTRVQSESLKDLDGALEICVKCLIILDDISIPSCNPDHYLFPMRDFATPVARFITQQCIEELGHLGVYNTRTTSVLTEYFLNHHDRQRSMLANIPMPKEQTNLPRHSILNQSTSNRLQMTGQGKSRLWTMHRNQRRLILFQWPKKKNLYIVTIY